MTVMVFGTFDGLHEGHLSYFKQARAYGDPLIAVVALDENVLKFKGNLPKLPQNRRLQDVQDCGLVDEACLGGKRFFDVLLKYRPDVVCLGYDQRADIAKVRELLPEVKIVRLQAYQPEKYKSSLLNTHNAKRITRNV